MSRVSIPFCTADYSVLNDETSNFGFGWSSFNSTFTPKSNLTNAYTAFQYTKAFTVSSMPITGLYNTYLAGGYVYTMSGNAQDIASNLTLLQENNWIDRQTRAVIVEFDVYNPNINMFAYCYIMIEFLPIGLLLPQWRFYPTTVFDDRTSLLTFSTISAVIFLVMIFLLTAKQAYNLKVHKMKYFKLSWTYLDLSLIAFSFTSFAIWLYRVWEAQSVMDRLSSNLNSSSGGKLISLQMLAYWDNVLVCMLAFCACLGSLKFFKLLQYVRTIKRISMAFNFALRNVVLSLFVNSILVFAWLQLAFVIFGGNNYEYSTFVKTIETGMCMILGKLPLEGMMQVSPLWTMIVHVTFNISVVWIMFPLVIVLLDEAYDFAKNNEKEQLDLGEYICEKIKSLFMALVPHKFRETKDADEEKLVPTSVEERSREMESFEEKINGILAHSSRYYQHAKVNQKTSKYVIFKLNQFFIYHYITIVDLFKGLSKI
jgi:hypothetical protein